MDRISNAKRLAFGFTGCLFLGLAGCGSELGAEVSGTVRLNDKPVGPGMIMFALVDQVTNPADGAVQIDGSYFLKTSGVVGLRPGKYRVSVTVLKQPNVTPGERSYEKPTVVTPERYADPTTSGLEYEVEPGKQTIDVELTTN